MNSSLFKDFFFVSTFWLGAGGTYWVLDPFWSPASWRTSWLPWIPWAGDSLIAIKLAVLSGWTLPLLVLAIVAFVAGVATSGREVWAAWQDRKIREAKKEGWRGMAISLDTFPFPDMLPMEPVEASEELLELFDGIPKAEVGVILEAMGVAMAHPDAFCGDGHGVSLAEHTGNVLWKALHTTTGDRGLQAAAAAVHDLGKITSYVKNEAGTWIRKKAHDKESARILATLPSWWEIPPDRRMALLLAVKYEHTPDLMPIAGTEGSITKLALSIMESLRASDGEATGEEKQEVLAQHDVPSAVLRAFIDTLPTFTFQTQGLPKGVKAAGWNKGNRVYFLEHQLRERSMQKLDPDVRAALGGTLRQKSKLADYTNILVQTFDEKGWLVKEVDGTAVAVQEALWDIKAGIAQIKGVIIVDLPPEFRDKLPSKDSSYAITIEGPHFQQASGTATLPTSFADDIFGKPKPKAEPLPDAQVVEVAPPLAALVESADAVLDSVAATAATPPASRVPTDPAAQVELALPEPEVPAPPPPPPPVKASAHKKPEDPLDVELPWDLLLMRKKDK